MCRDVRNLICNGAWHHVQLGVGYDTIQVMAGIENKWQAGVVLDVLQLQHHRKISMQSRMCDVNSIYELSGDRNTKRII